MNKHKSFFKKGKPERDKSYLKRVCELPCSVCGAYPVQAHHARGARFNTGMGIKASDYDTMPLCFKHHTEFHSGGALGEAAWEEKYLLQEIHIAKTKRILGKE